MSIPGVHAQPGGGIPAPQITRTASAPTPPPSSDDHADKVELHDQATHEPIINDNAKAHPSQSVPQTTTKRTNKKRETTLLEEHLDNPSLLTKEVVGGYTFDALTKAHDDVQKSLERAQEQHKDSSAQLASVQKLLEEHREANGDLTNAAGSAKGKVAPDKMAKINGAKYQRSLRLEENSLKAQVDAHKTSIANLGTKVEQLNTARQTHSPMRTKYMERYLGRTPLQSGMNHMNAAFLLLSIPSMFQMVRSFFPSKDKSDEGVPPQQIASTSGPQSFQPRGVVNHQANLMRQQQQQMGQIPPSLQSAFLQGPVPMPGYPDPGSLQQSGSGYAMQ